MSHHYEVCVVGAGSAGFAAAQRARELGKSVAIVECDRTLAGWCILRGCMPAKAVLHSAKVAETVEHASEVGVQAAKPHVDAAAVVARKRRLVREFAQERVDAIKSFPLFRGSWEFMDGGSISVNGTRVAAERFVLSMGSIVETPEPGTFGARPIITTDGALELTDVPPALTVAGGGPVGCEFAQYFARLDAQVTLLQDGPELLRGEDADVGRAVREGLERDGVRVLVGIDLRRAGDHGKGPLLWATRRRPNVCGFQLERAAVAYDAAGIHVDANLRTSNPRIYAAGDVLGRRMLVHAAVYCGARAVDNAFAASSQAVDFDLLEAHGVYTEPEVAVAGLSERDAASRGIQYRVASHDFSDHGRAITENELQGFAKIVAAPDGRILGVIIVGEGASERLQSALTLLYFRANVADVARIPHLHPTMAEILTLPAAELAAAP